MHVVDTHTHRHIHVHASTPAHTHTRWSFTNMFIRYNFTTKEPWNNFSHGPGLTTSYYHLLPQLKKDLGDKF
jgi:hypothetical protein